MSAEHELIVLDTSAVIAPPESLSRIAERVAVSTVTLAELAYGMHSQDPGKRLRRERRYQRVLRTCEPVELSENAARTFGAMAAAVAASGRQPRKRGFDLLIAATAADLGVPVMTRNGVDFEGLAGLVEVIAL